MKKSWLLGFVFLLLFSFAFAVSADEGSAEATIYTSSEGIMCYSNSTDSYIFNASKNPIEIINWTFKGGSSPTAANCSLSISSTGSFCCPSGYTCDFNNGKCIPDTVTNCQGFKTKEACIYSPGITSQKWFEFLNATTGASCNSVIGNSWTNNNVLCTNTSSCKCFWNETMSRCDSLYQVITPPVNVCGSNSDSFCFYGVGNETNNCDNALAKISVTYVPYGNAAGTGSCQTQTLDYPCSVSVKLPFFNWFSFVLTGLGIALVYFISVRSRKFY